MRQMGWPEISDQLEQVTKACAPHKLEGLGDQKEGLKPKENQKAPKVSRSLALENLKATASFQMSCELRRFAKFVSLGEASLILLTRRVS